MIERGVGFVGDPPVLALDKDGKLDEQTLTNLSLFLKSVAEALNGGLRMGEGPPLYAGLDLPAGVVAPNGQRAGNLAGQIRQYYFGAAGVTYDVPHDLGRKPLGVIVLHVNQNGAVVSGIDAGMWTETSLRLVCSVNATYATFIVV